MRPLMLMTLAVLSGCATAGRPAEKPPTAAHTAIGHEVMVATVNPLATEAAVATFRRGGNAVDAAIAAGLTLGVVDSHNSGLGGGAFILIRKANGEIIAIDGRERAAAKATRDMFIVDGKPQPQMTARGPLAAAVPGALMAYDTALKKAGRLTLADLTGPAADIAEKGFPAAVRFAELQARDADQFDAPTRAAFLKPDGSPHKAGEIVKLPDLARTLRMIGRYGTNWYYHGEFAQRLDTYMKQVGGIITAQDLADYHVAQREAITSTYRGYTLIAMPPTSSGGVHVAQVLNMLEAFDLAAMTQADRVHVMAEAMKLAFADRAYWLGDPDHAKVPRGLIDKSYARQLAARINIDHVTKVEQHSTPPRAASDIFGQKHTTHIAVADAEGNMVAMTQTINGSYGSKVTIPGTGVVLNNQMNDFSMQPGVPNLQGLIGAEANAIAPGKRPLSSMSPTIILDDEGRPFMTVGAAGAPRIITQVVEAIVNRLDLKMDLGTAVAAPRFHHQWSPDVLYVEAGMPAAVIDALKAKGHTIAPNPSAGNTNAVGWSFDRKYLVGAAEPRVGGRAGGY